MELELEVGTCINAELALGLEVQGRRWAWRELPQLSAEQARRVVATPMGNAKVNNQRVACATRGLVFRLWRRLVVRACRSGGPLGTAMMKYNSVAALYVRRWMLSYYILSCASSTVARECIDHSSSLPNFAATAANALSVISSASAMTSSVCAAQRKLL